MRLFIALNFNELKDYFNDLQKQIPIEDAKLTFPDEFHLTLKFLGDVDDSKVDDIKSKLKEIKFNPFGVNVSDIGFFSENFLKVIWIKADAKEIFDLQKKIDEKLTEFRKDDFEFQPHITLIRIKWCKDKKEFIEKIKEIRTEIKKVKISNFELVKSTLTEEGPVYEVISKF